MTELLAYIGPLAHGLFITSMLMLASVCVGLVMAIIMTICTYADNKILGAIIRSLVFFVRGTPLLVQIFLIYFGVGQFEWIRSTPLWIILREPMACAIIALSLNSACYTMVLLRGAIQSVPRNEIAACHALGMSKWLAFRRIIFPRAFRLALPAYSNEVIMILKGTSLASTITLLDLMGVTQQLIAQTYQPIQFYLVAGILYLLLNAVISLVFKRVLLTPSTLQ